MTATIDAPETETAVRPAPAEPRRASGPRWRAAGRLALRQVLRDWRTSALVAALVALPLAGISAAAVYADSQTPTPAEKAAVELGDTAAWFRVIGGPDPDRRQYLDAPEGTQYETDDRGNPLYSQDNPPDSPVDAVPAGTELLSLTPGQVEAKTAGGIGVLRAVIGDVGDPRLDGRLRLLDGTRPLGPNEAAASPAALDRLGLGLGDTLTLSDPAATFTITASMSQAADGNGAQVLFLPGLAAQLADAGDAASTTWYSPDWAPSADELYGLNAAGIVGYVPDLAAHPGDNASPAFETGTTYQLAVVGLVAAVLAFCAYLVVLLAGAAFAVSARRQQRQLAMAASVGAGTRDIFRIVVLQGTFLGAAGGAVGTAAGIGIGAWAIRFDANGSATHPWGLHVPWLALLGALAFAIIVGTLSALVPARTASRQNVIGALRGARRPARLRTSRPKWGSLLLLVGVALTLAGAALMFWVSQQPWQDGTTQLVTGVGMTAIILGPILLQLGVIMAGHWLLSVTARLLGRVGLGARLAARDAVAAPSRVVPAFGAIAACVFLASAALGAVGVTIARDARIHYYQAPVGSVALGVDAWEGDGNTQVSPPEETVDAALDALETTTDPTHIAPFDVSRALWSGDPGVPGDTPTVRAELQDYVPCGSDADVDFCDTPESARFGTPSGYGNQSQFVIAKAADLATITGGPVDADALAAYRDGAAIVTDDAWLTDEGGLVVNTWRLDQVDADADADAEPQATTTIPAVAIATGKMATGRELFVAPETARDLGITDTVFGGAVASYHDPPSVEERDRLREQLSGLTGRSTLNGGDSVDAHATLEEGPSGGATWYALIIAGTLVLVIGASGIALGLSRVERRADDATLAAVGGAPRLRRAVSFWQGLIIAGFGCVTGTAAGILPVIGAVLADHQASDQELRLADMPWPALVVLAIAVPLLIAAVTWLVPPRAADLSRRTAIA